MRGYNKDFVSEAFERAENLDRSKMYNVKEIENNTKICIPLVMDTNPPLPNITKILNKRKHILSLDPKFTKCIPLNSIFVTLSVMSQPKPSETCSSPVNVLKDLDVHQ